MSEQQLEICRVRIEELDRNYMSLREIEWKVAIEFITGYAAVAVSHFHLRGQLPGFFVTGAGIVLPVAIFSVYWFLGQRIQERLRYVRSARNRYIVKMHELANLEQLEKDEPPLPYQFRYAFWSQLTFHGVAMVSVVMYVIVAAMTK